MTEKKQNNSDFTFFMSGDGMIRREHNIDVFKNLIKAGLSYQQIVRKARKKFRSKTIEEYYGIALDEVNNGIDYNEESFMEQVKKGKIKPRKDVPDS